MSYDYTDLTTGDDLYEYELETRFDDFFNEVYPEVEFGELSYLASSVLREVDPIAYREEFNNWLDSEIQDGNYREYVDSPVCEDCGSTLSQDDVTESMANYDRLVCPSCADDDCDVMGTDPDGVRLLCTETDEHDEHMAQRFEHGGGTYRLVTIPGVVWDED